MNKKKSKAIVALLTLALLLLTIATIVACMGSDDVEKLPEPPAIEFEDVSPEDWFYRYVAAGVRFGIITAENGESLYFEPDRYVTQGEFITMLGRLHEYGHGAIGTPDEGGDCDERYLEWVLENEIVHSYRYWDLIPSEYITREQKAVIVYRYIDVFDLHDNFLHVYDVIMALFSDTSQMSHWARMPIERLRLRLMVFGRYRHYFMPHDSVAHAESLQILIRIGSAVYDSVHPLLWM